MQTNVILLDLDNFRREDGVIFVGTEYGKYVASLFNLRVKLAKNKKLIIYIPDDVLAISPSFFKGLFEDSLPYKNYEEAKEMIIVSSNKIQLKQALTDQVYKVLRTKYGVVRKDEDKSGYLFSKEW